MIIEERRTIFSGNDGLYLLRLINANFANSQESNPTRSMIACSLTAQFPNRRKKHLGFGTNPFV